MSGPDIRGPRFDNTEYRTALKRLGLVHGRAHEFFGVDKATAMRWYRDREPVPALVMRLMRVLIWAEVSGDELAAARESMETPLDG